MAPAMTHAAHRTPSRRHALWFWLLTVAVLLKAATPWLAVMAAERQGLPLGEVCSVYGVRPAPGTGEPASPSGHMGADGHCALAPLLAFGAPPVDATGPALPPPSGTALPQGPPPQVELPADALRRWLTARLHAPPHAA